MGRRAALILLEAYLVISSILVPIVYNAASTYFRYFTALSNLFMGLCALILLIVLLIGRGRPAKWVSLLQLSGTTAVTLTMITVIFFLVPTQSASWGGPLYFFLNDMLFFHLLNPIVAIVCYTLLEKSHRHPMRCALFGILPCAIYSVFYTIHVAVYKDWPDFYGFTFGGNYPIIPIVLLAMYVLSYGLSLLLLLGHNTGVDH